MNDYDSSSESSGNSSPTTGAKASAGAASEGLTTSTTNTTSRADTDAKPKNDTTDPVGIQLRQYYSPVFDMTWAYSAGNISTPKKKDVVEAAERSQE